MKPDLKTLFPKASKSFYDANPDPSKMGNLGNDLALGRGPTSKNDVHPIVATRRGKMNKTEAEYAMILEAMKQKGEILRYEFEGITLRFANVKYTPDFVVFRQYQKVIRVDVQGQTIGIQVCPSFIEVKGPFCKGKFERAVERFRHAKTYWPEMTFEMWQKTKEGWKQLI